MADNFASRCRRNVFLVSKYMLLEPKNPFLLTIRVNFNTISKLGTNMYCIGYLPTRNVRVKFINSDDRDSPVHHQTHHTRLAVQNYYNQYHGTVRIPQST